MLTNKRLVWLAGVVSIAACSAAMGQDGADPADPVAPPKKAVRKNPAPVTPSEGGGTPFEPTPADPAGTPAVGTTPPRPTTPPGVGSAPPIGVIPRATNPLGMPGSGPSAQGGPPVLDPNGGSGGPSLPNFAGMPGMPGMTPPRQAPKKVGEMKLEELLQHALQQNAEILSAQSKVREAEMEAIRTRQKVLANVVVKQADYEAAKAIHTEVDARYKQVQQLHKQKVLSDAELSTAKMAELSAKADLIRAEAALSGACAIAPPGMGADRLGNFYPGTMGTVSPVRPSVNEANFNLLEGGTGSVVVGPPRSPTISSAAKPTAATNAGLSALTKKLATKIKLTPELKELSAVLDTIGGQTDLAFLLDGQIENMSTATTVPRELPLGAALQWMEDAFGVRCVVREYGIVVTREDRVPPGALSASDLWRSSEQSILGGQSPRASDPLVEQKVAP